MYLYSFRFLLYGDLITFTEESDRLLHIRLLPQEEAHPARLRQNVVRLCASCRNDLIAHFFREREIHQVVAVDVPDLTFANAILHAAKAMRLHRHTWPGCNLL